MKRDPLPDNEAGQHQLPLRQLGSDEGLGQQPFEQRGGVRGTLVLGKPVGAADGIKLARVDATRTSRPPSFSSIENRASSAETLAICPAYPDGRSRPTQDGHESDEGVDEKDEKHLAGRDGVIPPTLPESQSVELIDGRPKDVYDRFTKAQKRRILLIVSYSAIIAPMTSSIFLPAIPQMAADLGTTPSIINITVAVFILVIGIAPVLWSPYAGFYGRRPVYLASMPVMVVASIGVALCQNVAALTGTRILQGIGSSCFLAVGAGSVGDIFRPTERARGMATFYMVVLLGPAISPVIAGLLAEYTAGAWRSTQYFLAGCGALSVILVFTFLPETSHPPLPHETLKLEKGKKFVWYWCNPFKSLGLLMWPNIALICLISSCGMIDTYCLLVPLSAVFKDRYGIHNLAISGCLYLSNGLGNVLGSKIAGPISDGVVKRYIAKRGYRRPEDRLRSAFFGIGVLMPASILVYGWLLEYGAGGMAPPLVMVFLNGLALSLAFGPLNTYLVDSMQSRSAEVIAVNNCIRYVFAAGASAAVLPIANAIGWGPTMTICFVLTMLSAVALWLVYRYGDKWREAANKRYGMTRREADEEKVDAGKDEESAVGVCSEAEKGEQVVERGVHNVIERKGGGDLGTSHHQHQHRNHGEDHDRHDHHRHHDHKANKGEEGQEEHEFYEHPSHLDQLQNKENERNKRHTLSSTSNSRQNSSKNTRPELGSRHTTRGEMPPVEQVLKRTVSLSGASVHGGG